MKNNSLLLALLLFGLTQCKQQTAISKSEMLQIVKSLDAKFSLGIRNKDAVMLTEIYSDSAQYVQPNREILTGKEEIKKDWAGFLELKQKPIDLILVPNTVRGTREIIYETGTGYTLLADSTKWQFSYVNVWRLGNDATYKLEVDTYTPL